MEYQVLVHQMYQVHVQLYWYPGTLSTGTGTSYMYLVPVHVHLLYQHSCTSRDPSLLNISTRVRYRTGTAVFEYMYWTGTYSCIAVPVLKFKTVVVEYMYMQYHYIHSCTAIPVLKISTVGLTECYISSNMHELWEVDQ